MNETLLQKNTRVLLIWLPVVLLACCLLFYVLMRMQAHHMQLKQLLLKQDNTWNAFVQKNGNIEKSITGEYQISKAAGRVEDKTDELRDTVIYYPAIKKSLPFQLLTRSYEWQNSRYLVTTFVSSTEITHLIIKVFLTEIGILILLLVAIVILNRKNAGSLWRPFFSSMQKANEYDITTQQSLSLPAETGIAEFNELNATLTRLTSNVNDAFQRQKQFVENASHEMQTPLAIIRSKLELLINQPNLTEKAASLLGDINEANDRLSQMNRTLLLLAKIENNQFPAVEEVDVSKMLRQLLDNFQHHYDEFPATTTAIDEGVTVIANPSLIEILLTNLLKNAVVHNVPGGKITITLTASGYIIENTGLPTETPANELFDRFKKGSHQNKTTGLGLALVKQICSLYRYTVSYQFRNGWHTVTIIFK